MSVMKVAKLQHPKASGPALTLAPDGTVFIAGGVKLATADLEDVAEVPPAGGQTLIYDEPSESWIPGTISFNTDQIQEGNTNLYFTESRVDARTAANRAPLQFAENLRDTNYTLALTDAARVVAFDSTQPTTLTIPANSSVPFPIGTVINVYRAGTGSVTIEPAGAAVIRNPESKNTYDIAERYAEVSLRKRGTDEWVLSGNVE